MNKKLISLLALPTLLAAPIALNAGEDIPKGVQRTFANFDADSNGTLSPDEFEKGNVAAAEKRLLKNGVKGEELAKKVKNVGKNSSARFTSADKDSDGELNLKEFFSTRNTANAKNRKKS
ncbi:MAG: hypothetical protein AAGB46_09675 [Verrucomicrobiota bacterium]